MKDMEDRIRNALLQDIELPSEYKYMIRNTLKIQERKTRRSTKLVKLLATACASIVIITSIVYAKDISNIIYQFFNNNKGMNFAISEGYIDEPNVNYIKSDEVIGNDNGDIINAYNTEVKVKNMLMDDYNLSFTFLIKLDDNIDVSKIIDAWFPDMLITDENNKIIYCTDKLLFDKYCLENKLNYEYDVFNENHINNEINHYTKAALIEENTIELIYNFNASVYHYPKSKKLYININKINLSRASFNQDNVILNGKWNLNLDVSEKFYKREAIVYTVKSCNDENINITEACVYNTGIVLEFTSKDKPIWNEDDSVEIQREKLWQFKNNKDNLESKGIKFINDEYIKNENGDIFRPIEGNFESSGTVYEYNGNFKHWQTFDMTRNKATNELIVNIDLFLQDNRRNVVIELERCK